MQSNVHIFPSPGIKFMPKDSPNRLLFTGPNIGDLCNSVAIFLVLCFSKILLCKPKLFGNYI